MLKLGTVKQRSHTSGILPPSRPENPTVGIPTSRAARSARLTFAELRSSSAGR